MVYYNTGAREKEYTKKVKIYTFVMEKQKKGLILKSGKQKNGGISMPVVNLDKVMHTASFIILRGEPIRRRSGNPRRFR